MRPNLALARLAALVEVASWAVQVVELPLSPEVIQTREGSTPVCLAAAVVRSMSPTFVPT